MIRFGEAVAGGDPSRETGEPGTGLTLLWAGGAPSPAAGGAAPGPEPGLRRSVLRRLTARDDAPEVRERVLVRDGPAGDPFRLRAHLAGAPGGPALLVAPRRWGPRRLAPAPVVEGSPVGLLLADGAAHLPPELPLSGPTRPTPPWVVAAMAKDVFLRPTQGWADTLNRAGRPTLDLRADRARRPELAAALRAGPGVVLYAGHGRNRGWGGYQGLRLHHLVHPAPADSPAIPAPAPAGLVIAFACDTLKRSRSRDAFGSGLVEAGCTRAYLGAVGALRTSDAEALAEVVIHLLATGVHPTAGSLLQGIEAAVGGTGAPRRAWRHFRLMGDPSAPLHPPGPVAERIPLTLRT